MKQLVLIFITLIFGWSAWAQSSSNNDNRVYIDVGQASVKRSLLAFPPLKNLGTGTYAELEKTLFQVLTNNLTVSSYFTFIKPEAFLEDPAKVGLRPAPGTPGGFNFNNWSTIGAEFLIRAGYSVTGDTVRLETYLYHVPRANLILGRTYEGSKLTVRRMAHTYANDIIEALTGKKGMFLTKIVASRQDGGKGNKEIFVMDWDGHNPDPITNHKSLAISPAWSPDGKKVAYTAYAFHTKEKRRNANLFIYETDTSRRFMVSYRQGINSGAAFMPDGKHVLLTISQTGSPDIFRMTLDGKSLDRLTHGPKSAMNVEPVVSPDGQSIAFSSDRDGRPMLYTMGIKGGPAKRLTFAGRYNASPSWSPDGKQIAFASFDKGAFNIYVINADGTGLKKLTESRRQADGGPANSESPSFSPCGRHIVFTSNRTGKNQLYIVNPDGTNERRITYDNHAYDKPKWSPFLD